MVAASSSAECKVQTSAVVKFLPAPWKQSKKVFSVHSSLRVSQASATDGAHVASPSQSSATELEPLPASACELTHSSATSCTGPVSLRAADTELRGRRMRVTAMPGPPPSENSGKVSVCWFVARFVNTQRGLLGS